MASGPIDGFAPGEDVNGVTVVGSEARVDFRVDAAGNQNLILFRLIYIEGSEVNGWIELGWYDERSQLGYDPATHGLTGCFTLSHTVNPTGPATENPERADIHSVCDPSAGRLSGTVTHTETSFMLDLAAEEVALDFFADPRCYPTPVDNPVDSTGVGGG